VTVPRGTSYPQGPEPITDRAEAVEAAARYICEMRSDHWPDEDDAACARMDAQAALDAIGWDALVASRERAIRFAVRFESENERAVELLEELKP
jgi:hypothetical protein